MSYLEYRVLGKRVAQTENVKMRRVYPGEYHLDYGKYGMRLRKVGREWALYILSEPVYPGDAPDEEWDSTHPTRKQAATRAAEMARHK